MKEKIKNFGKKIQKKVSGLWDDHKEEIGLGALWSLNAIIVLASVRALHLYNKNQKLDYKIKMAQLNNK